MKDMTIKELTSLGNDLKMAKILVLHKHGFTSVEIARAMGLSESTIRRLINSAEKDSERPVEEG